MRYSLLTALAAACLALAPWPQAAQACCSCQATAQHQSDLSWQDTMPTFEVNLNNEIQAHQDWLANEWWKKHFLEAMKEYAEFLTLTEGVDTALGAQIGTFKEEVDKTQNQAKGQADEALKLALPNGALGEAVVGAQERTVKGLGAQTGALALKGMPDVSDLALAGSFKNPKTGAPDLKAVFSAGDLECDVVTNTGKDCDAVYKKMALGQSQRTPIHPAVQAAACERDPGVCINAYVLKGFGEDTERMAAKGLAERLTDPDDPGQRSLRKLQEEAAEWGINPVITARRAAEGPTYLARLVAADAARDAVIAMERLKAASDAEAFARAELSIAMHKVNSTGGIGASLMTGQMDAAPANLVADAGGAGP
jgi:hypothetical protein